MQKLFKPMKFDCIHEMVKCACVCLSVYACLCVSWLVGLEFNGPVNTVKVMLRVSICVCSFKNISVI